jgi:outer membrane protein OmpA-like peptidoglycan-associated protein
MFASTAPPAPRTQVARAEPAPSQTPTPGMAKRSMILFAAGAPDPSRDSLSAIKFLAGDLNAALAGDAGARIQLQAFGGDKGDKGSDARRLSLKRALAIRQVLIDDGVSADRINVSAMGGADDGPPDRVDVYLKS